MRTLTIIGDGERDKVTVPALVRGVVGDDFGCTADCWQDIRLHTGEKKIRGYVLKGYGSKLLYSLQRARSRKLDGVVATIDADKDRHRERLSDMKNAREADRSQRPPLPCAVGEARPHNEAWLLDDPVAVRKGLGLPASAAVPSVANCPSPKTILEALHAASPRADDRPLVVWGDIAARVRPERCGGRERTGFQAFTSDLRAELGRLFAGTA